jgi:hypothetical protein
VLRGVRKRLQREREDRLTLAYECATLGAVAQNGKLGRLDEYLARVRPRKKLNPQQLLQVFRDLAGAGAPMTISEGE